MSTLRGNIQKPHETMAMTMTWARTRAMARTRALIFLLVILSISLLSGCRGRYGTISLKDAKKELEIYSDSHMNNINSPLVLISNSVKKEIETEILDKESKEKGREFELGINKDKHTLKLSDYIEIPRFTVGKREYSSIEEFMSSDSLFGSYIGKEVNREVEIDKIVNIDGIKEWSNEQSNKYYKKYKKPSVGFNNGVTAVDMGSNGAYVDKNTLDQLVTESIENNTYSAKIETIEISSHTSEEELMAINSKISSFSTGYSSSGSSRKNNIRVATQRLNGVLLLPGEEISIDKVILSRNMENGYSKAGSYLNGKTVQTYGGGVCQVSTTMYGAVLRAGIIPTERNAHSMAVGYVPLGLDAAISEGYKDLKFKNTYSTPIYISGDANGSTLTFEIWGRENITGGKKYKPRSVVKNSLSADAYLDIYESGKIVGTKTLKSSSYKPHN